MTVSARFSAARRSKGSLLGSGVAALGVVVVAGEVKANAEVDVVNVSRRA